MIKKWWCDIYIFLVFLSSAKLLLYVNDKEVIKLDNIKDKDIIKLIVIDKDDNKNTYGKQEGSGGEQAGPFTDRNLVSLGSV